MNRTKSELRNNAIEIEHPVEGTVKSPGFPVKMRGTPQRVRRPAPLLGQHNDEVAAELRLDSTELRAARSFE